MQQILLGLFGADGVGANWLINYVSIDIMGRQAQLSVVVIDSYVWKIFKDDQILHCELEISSQ